MVVGKTADRITVCNPRYSNDGQVCWADHVGPTPLTNCKKYKGMCWLPIIINQDQIYNFVYWLKPCENMMAYRIKNIPHPWTMYQSTDKQPSSAVHAYYCIALQLAAKITIVT